MWFLVRVSGTNDTYYFNPETQKTSWSRPLGVGEPVPLYDKAYDGPIARVNAVASDLFYAKRNERKSQQKQCQQTNKESQTLKSIPDKSRIASRQSATERLPKQSASHAASLMDQLYPDVPVGIPPRRLLRLLQQPRLRATCDKIKEEIFQINTDAEYLDEQSRYERLRAFDKAINDSRGARRTWRSCVTNRQLVDYAASFWTQCTSADARALVARLLMAPLRQCFASDDEFVAALVAHFRRRGHLGTLWAHVLKGLAEAKALLRFSLGIEHKDATAVREGANADCRMFLELLKVVLTHAKLCHRELPNYCVLEAVMTVMTVCDEETLLLATTTLASANARYAHLETNMVLALCAAHPLVDVFCEALMHCIASHPQKDECWKVVDNLLQDQRTTHVWYPDDYAVLVDLALAETDAEVKSESLRVLERVLPRCRRARSSGVLYREVEARRAIERRSVGVEHGEVSR